MTELVNLRGQRTWTTTAAQRHIGPYLLRVFRAGGNPKLKWWWVVLDAKTGTVQVDGYAADEKTAKLKARQWVDARLREAASR
jgi:hypothetical protein